MVSSLSSLCRCGLFNNYSLKFRCIQAERILVRPLLATILSRGEGGLPMFEVSGSCQCTAVENNIGRI